MPGALDELRMRPIPPLDAVRQAKQGYRAWPIEAGAEQDALVDLRETFAGKNFYNCIDNPPYRERIPGSVPALWARSAIASMLRTVNERLAPAGLELFIHDAWRPAAVQNYMHDHWLPQYLRQLHPAWSDEKITETVSQYWAHGPATDADVDPSSPPPHATGGAVDLTLRTLGGEPLWMGTVFDDVSVRAHTDALEGLQEEELSFSDLEARGNRRLLYWLMREAGFANNPTEWWHYSYGDQMWAKLASAEAENEVPARYSNIVPE